MVTKGDLTLGSKHTMKYTDHILQDCILKTYIVLLAYVTLINFLLI